MQVKKGPDHRYDLVLFLGNIDNEGLIWGEREDHLFGFRCATISQRLQADQVLLLAALDAQQSPATSPSLIHEAATISVRGGW